MTGLAHAQPAKPSFKVDLLPKYKVSVVVAPKVNKVDIVAKPRFDLDLAISLGSKIAKYGRDNVGNRIGGGECSDFVIAALASAGAKPGDFREYRNYVWGTRVPDNAAILPGDIIQFEHCHFYWNTGNSWGKSDMDHHTAIIESANGKALVLLHQNAPEGSAVVRKNLDLNTLLPGPDSQGNYPKVTIWRAVKP